MKNIEKIYKDLTIGEKVNLMKMLTAEFEKLVVYQTEDDPQAKVSTWTMLRDGGMNWLSQHRKSEYIICPKCKTRNLLEYFEDIEDFPEESIVKNPLKVTYSCHECSYTMGKTIWFTAKYPFSTSTTYDHVTYTHC